MSNEEITIFCDGGSRGNPGPSAGAFVVVDSRGKVIHEFGEYLGTNTNNFAEYRALVLALEWLTDQKETFDVVIKLDSELVVKQTNGLYRVKSPSIFEMAVKVKALKERLGARVKVVHIPRAENHLADSLVNQTLDEHLNLV